MGNWGELEKYKRKLQNRCNELFIRLQKTFVEKETKKQKEKDMDKKLHEIKECVDKIKNKSIK